MAKPVKPCGRKFIHEPHFWNEPVLNVDYASWPKFQCQGVRTGQTEQEFLRGLRANVEAMPIKVTEETTDDAARRFAFKLDRISKIQSFPARKIPVDERVIRLSDLKAILEED